MDLNKFAETLIGQLTRIADALEGGAKVSGNTAAAATEAAPAEKPAAKPKAAATKPKAEVKASTKPKNDRDAVKKGLITVKDTVSKEAAQAIYQEFGYAAMSAIEEKDFDAIFDKCTEVLAANEPGGDEEEDDGL